MNTEQARPCRYGRGIMNAEGQIELSLHHSTFRVRHSIFLWQ